MAVTGREARRGRHARSPQDIPKAGWMDILKRTKEDIGRHFLSLGAAGVAFYGLLALFPALAAVVSIYGLIADPATVERQLSAISGMLPAEAHQIISEQLHGLVRQSSTTLGFSAVFAIAVSIWSATKGVGALLQALNIAYEEREERGFFKYKGLLLLFTLGGILFVLFNVTLVAVLPALLGMLGLGETGQTLANWLRWPVLIVGMMLALSILYRYGPSRDEARWQWVSWGAVLATVLWLVASVLFSLYVSNFGSYNETYGSMGAVIILMMWLYLSAFAVLIGAQLNAELEHQTVMDTTQGRPKPRGARDAKMADTVGEKR